MVFDDDVAKPSPTHSLGRRRTAAEHSGLPKENGIVSHESRFRCFQEGLVRMVEDLSNQYGSHLDDPQIVGTPW